MEILAKPSGLVEAQAMAVAEAVLELRNAEKQYARAKALERELSGSSASKTSSKWAGQRVRDAQVDLQIAVIGYEFCRSAPKWVPVNHKIRLRRLETVKMDEGWTAEKLAERLRLPESTLFLIEDGTGVEVGIASRIAHVLGVPLKALALEEGQSPRQYWRS